MRREPGPRSFALSWLVPALMVLVPVAILVAIRGFAGLYGQDAFGYVLYGLGPMRAALIQPALPPAWPEPPGYPAIVAAISLVVGPDGRIGQVVSLAAGAAVPPLTALLAAEILRPWLARRGSLVVPLAAGLVAAMPGQIWQSSAVAMADTPSLALATAAAWAVCRYARAAGAGWLLGAAAALALAIDTRWVYGLVAIPLAIVGLGGARRVWMDDPRRAVRHAVGAMAVTLLVLGPVLGQMAAAVLAGTPVPFAADLAAYRWDPANAFRSTFETTDGRLAYGTTSGFFYAAQIFEPYWLGPVALLVLPGVAWTMGRGRWTPALVLVGWPLVVLAFLAGSPYQNTRFLIAALPPIATLVAVGAWRVALFARARARFPAYVQWAAAPMAMTAVVAWLAVGAVAAAGFTDDFIGRQSRDLAAIRTLEARIPTGATVLSMGPTGTLTYDGVARVVELFGLAPADATALTRDGRATYLLVDPDAIDGQWAGLRPALDVAAIRANRGLTAEARAGAWTLYLVGPASSSAGVVGDVRRESGPASASAAGAPDPSSRARSRSSPSASVTR